ncbi:transcription elongation factor B polypeptide 3-like [Bradysia coprophila]|uniref:transcription elongation factor B polypeptide 3-like n=1 Tax=Bradysia coprophila TaxID=38358 RepID=UPI00187DBF2F|nr:transcription elongation factor B polypeptide 3-like [Bradysia coprophila]
MASIKEAIRHYQRRIERFVENETILLHCLEKLNKLPVVVKYLQETRVGSTVNNLRKHDGKVGLAAAALVAKWKKEVDSKSSGEHERRHTNDTKNVEPSAVLNKVTDSQETNGTPNSDSVNYPSDSRSSRSEKSQEESNRLERKSGKKCDETRSCTSTSSVSNSKDMRENGSTESSHRRDKRKHSKQRECEETNGKKRKCGPDLIDIDYTMGTSFAEALGMLDMPSTSKARKLLTNKTSPSNTSPSRLGKRSSFDETPILLKNRPRLDPPQDIAAELLLPNTSSATEVITREYVSRQPRKQTIQMTDEETISHSITSRTVKTKVFSGNKADKSKVTTLFEMCIRILQDNIDLLEFIGGVPFDILRPVLERTTCEQLMALEDYNPYLMEDTHCLWEQHCKRRFRSKSREELETWRDMYIRCLDEEQTKFNILTASIKLSKERQTKPAFVDTNAPVKPKGMKSSALRVAGPVGDSKLQNVTKLKDSTQKPKRTKQLNDDPDWTPTTWYKTLYKKPKVPKPVKPPKPPIKKTIDMLRYDRARALEHKKEEWKKRPR